MIQVKYTQRQAYTVLPDGLSNSVLVFRCVSAGIVMTILKLTNIFQFLDGSLAVKFDENVPTTQRINPTTLVTL